MEHVKKQKFAGLKMYLSLPVQAGIVLAMLGIVLYTFLFSTYPPVHDAVHELRHSLMVIPCH